MDLNEFLELDYLIFSAHKTGTQTLVATLNANGFNARHCHTLGNLSLTRRRFRRYLKSYREERTKRLKIVSVFRDPMERLISSFFQIYGTDPVNQKAVSDSSETLIAALPVNQLQQKFEQEIRMQSLIGLEESIPRLCQILQVDTGSLNYDVVKKFGIVDGELFQITLFQFASLFENFSELTLQLTGKELAPETTNVGEDKWYRDIYSLFKDDLRLPETTIRAILSDRKLLIDVFYPDAYPQLQANYLEQYGEKS